MSARAIKGEWVGVKGMSQIIKLTPLIIALLIASGVSVAENSEVDSAEQFRPEIATTVVLPENIGQQWVWVYGSRFPSMADGRAFLLDEEGVQLGQLSTGYWFNAMAVASERAEIVTTETYFSRGIRGERTDIVSIYDPRSLEFVAEIEIPPKRMTGAKNDQTLALTDDERFAMIANYTPAQSVSIVDLETRQFVEEVETPGCTLLYTAGDRDFYSICADGAFLRIGLSDDGKVTAKMKSEPLFDPVGDFLTITGSRMGNTWYFASRNCNAYAVKMDDEAIEVVDSWSLLTDQEREAGWMISGLKNTAAHAPSGRLYVLMHQGEHSTFEDPGTHVWVYDVEKKMKVGEFALLDFALAIDVSQDANPRLYSIDFHIPLAETPLMWIMENEGPSGFDALLAQRLNVYDALTGEHIHASGLIFDGGGVAGVRAWN